EAQHCPLFLPCSCLAVWLTLHSHSSPFPLPHIASHSYSNTSFSSLVMNQAYKCAYCQCQLTPSTMTTNTNGNLGHQYVLCTAWPEGEFGPGKMSHQHYFRWVDRTPSPSTMAAQTLSPPLPSPPLTALASTTTTFPPPLPFQLPTYC
ncbi:hypothetical protein L208DRAFT_1403869, partial [Tricholoma matsutake]